MFALRVLSTSKRCTFHDSSMAFWARVGIQQLRGFSNHRSLASSTVLKMCQCQNHQNPQPIAPVQHEKASRSKTVHSFSQCREFKRCLNTIQKSASKQDLIDSQDESIGNILRTNMTVITDFISEDEEKSLFDELERYMRRLRYEFDHWDNAIHGYRETERKSWNPANQVILDRVKSLAFPAEVSPLAYVHVLDISKEGYIKPHVDAVRFCGDTIAGMCLLSSCVMRLALEKDSSLYGDIHLPQRCLYIMKGPARYDFTHEVLKEEESKFKGQVIPRDRRISVICRNEPNPDDTQ